MLPKDDSSATKAERAAALRAARRAALEAKALRQNLRRRKAQTHARATSPTPAEAGTKECP
jgi:hypothetical protein